MSGETKLTIVGNLTADPELRYTQAGIAVVNLTIASTPREFDKATGQQKDGEPLFLRSSAWRDFAEHIAATCKKGTRVIASGTLRQRRYQTEAGEHRTSMELALDALGPDLRFATASVTKTMTGQTTPASSPAAADDAWYTPADSTYDETPF